ncbi:TetR/AcrR family transcriptional regulator [Corynebacterium lubricantis]|uniref:TetR/AcrR family transcriptional regulator n=1 Tax=Corynebacterium lubricantis TaxID=541095 RepID=UPI000378550C|nr:TetR family transcriptional regulator [Corynebacterium lubricantis]
MPAIIDHDQRRNELARAALELAAHHGLEGVTIRRVATATGYSPGTVQHYFPTRADLIGRTLELLGSKQREQFLSVDQTLEPRALILAVVRAYMPTNAEERTIAGGGAAFYLASLYDEALRRQVSLGPAALISVITRILEGAARDGALAEGVEPSHEASILWGFFDPSPVLAGYRTAEETLATVEYYLDRIFS